MAEAGFSASSPTEDAANQIKFLSAFVASLSTIVVSELGDKTFFIAAIMAMRNNRLTIFAAAISALMLMTVLSAALGFALPNILSPRYTHYASTGLFLFFGAKLLYDAYKMDSDGDKKEEMEEVEEELQKRDDDDSGKDIERGVVSGKSKDSLLYQFFSPVFIQCFTMTFLAEWGDRSQITTIALAADQDVVGVTLGGILGHSLCTGLAILGGKFLAAKISEKAVNVVGGLLFLIFAIHGAMAQETSA